MNGFVYSLRFVLNLSIVFSLTFGILVRAEAPTEPDTREHATGSIAVQDQDPTRPGLKLGFDVKILEPSDEPAALADALSQSKDAETVIVSTDENQILTQAATRADERVVLLPFGKAIRKSADIAKGVNALIRGTPGYLKQAFLKDKIGFGIATITLGTEVIRWIHVTNASTFAMTSNIVYSILWAMIFVDKDTWSKTTKPLQRTFRRIFKLSQVIPDQPTFQDTGMKFLAGLSLSMILNSGRAMIVGIDQLARGTFDALALSMPYVMGAVMTAVGFSWSELVGRIDPSRHPRSKKIVRFVMNARSVILAWTAASAMLMHPEQFGIRPWLLVAISGATGLVLYSTVKAWIDPLETLTGSRCARLFAQ